MVHSAQTIATTTMAPLETAIIGAGSSGIVAAKIFHERGLPFDVFEKGSAIGGLWRYDNDNGLSAAYGSLHINTSRDKMAYSDFPMPRELPDFPHHSQILRYFESYVEHFGFGDRITFRTTVERVEPAAEGGYEVTARGDDDSPRRRRYGAVVVANGHHWCPKRPRFPGELDGLEIHSHDYREPSPFADKNVVVVGIGNSGCDISCELSRAARRTFLSTRRSAHVLPKYLLGRPLDAWNTPLFSRFPISVQSALFGGLVHLGRGRQERYGLRLPQHKLGHEHPTISAELLELVRQDAIEVKPNIERLEGDRVRFVDGSVEPVDAIVYATGYRIAFPFFEEGLLSAPDNEIPLYKRVVPPGLSDLYFLGLIQPLGAVMPLAEAQAEWVADLVQGCAALPDPEAMRRDIAEEQAKVRRRYVSSPRHTIQVDFYPYLRTIARERRRGHRRASRRQRSSRPGLTAAGRPA